MSRLEIEPTTERRESNALTTTPASHPIKLISMTVATTNSIEPSSLLTSCSPVARSNPPPAAQNSTTMHSLSPLHAHGTLFPVSSAPSLPTFRRLSNTHLRFSSTRLMPTCSVFRGHAVDSATGVSRSRIQESGTVCLLCCDSRTSNSDS